MIEFKVPTGQGYVRTQLIEGICDYIVQNRLSPGMKLPSERALATLFECSRVPVREALKTLEATGIITIQVGKGAFVSRCNLSDVIERYHPIISGDLTDLPTLTEARIMMEIGLVDLAMDKVTDRDIRELDSVAEGFSRAKTIEELTQVDYQFHQLLAQLSGNLLLVEFSSVLKRFFDKVCEDEMRVRNGDQSLEERMMRHHVESHQELMQAIRARDKELAKKLMREHILGQVALTNPLQQNDR